MSARYSSSIAFVLVSLVVVAELAYYLPQLPDTFVPGAVDYGATLRPCGAEFGLDQAVESRN